MTANDVETGATMVSDGHLWTRLTCAGPICRYASEHPGPPVEGDLDRMCPLCAAPFAAVTVYRLSTVEVSAASTRVSP